LQNDKLNNAVDAINNNQVVGIPTETVYGLAANAYSSKATSKIFKLKKRPKENPLIVHYIYLKMLKKDCEINNSFIKLYKKFSPGPLTYVLKLKKNSKISKFVTNNKKTVAIRFPRHPLFRKLLKNLEYPVAAPSANISSRLSAVKAADVKEEFGSKIKFILNGGICKIGVESTIISIINKPRLLRYGGLGVSKIKKTLRKNIIININSKDKISPGLFPLHYSPGLPLRMNAKKNKINEAFVLVKKRENVSKNIYYLSKTNNLNEAAKNLYSVLRKIKKDKYKSIAVEKIPNEGIGKTINDRLKRASNFKWKTQ